MIGLGEKLGLINGMGEGNALTGILATMLGGWRNKGGGAWWSDIDQPYLSANLPLLIWKPSSSF